ncbi:unnamed protein product [Notodromas monacha]|uniref:Uncharacterized protein n=1 Tax=Notodromas monacha TaxID=399045 RepID=A0A7R9BLM3_9CRUS|nr:unnamed protein product [Notodromas monacha]CAG0917755.1 unnamed protein product [Notodromas monacha]
MVSRVSRGLKAAGYVVVEMWDFLGSDLREKNEFEAASWASMSLTDRCEACRAKYRQVLKAKYSDLMEAYRTKLGPRFPYCPPPHRRPRSYLVRIRASKFRRLTYARVDVGDAVQGSSRSTAKSLEDHHPQQREQQKRSNNKDSIVREPDERAASKRLDAVVGRLGDGFHHHRLHQPAAGLPTTATPSSATLRRQARAKPAQIPRFYYPMGRPKSATELEQACRRVADAFDSVAQPFATREDFAMIAKACDLPLYLKAPLFFCAVAQGCHSPGQTTGSQDSVTIGKQEFLDFWRRCVIGIVDNSWMSTFIIIIISCLGTFEGTLMTHHDVCAQFIHVLSRGAPRGSKPYLLPEDLVAMVQDIVDTHPGLAFLREAQEFHFRYVRTVIARIYYCVNRSWSGRITLPELRRSNLLQVISMLETEEDINQITEYFSYEHFYVIYCKFWELDRDHDLFIDRLDLARHADGAISSRMIDRIFSGAVTRGQGHTRGPGNQLMRRSEERHRMSYPEFIWFLISEEDKRHPTAVEYWFRFMLDLVQPAKSGMISLGDLKRCHQTPIFFDTFFNLEKYLEHEHRDPFAVQARDPDNPEQQLSDWEKYCIEEYEQLVAEEGAGDATEIMYDDDMEDESGDIDELSPNLDQIIIVDAPDGKHIVTEPDDDFADYADA